MPIGTPIYSYTFVSQAKTTTYSYSIANLSCTLSTNDVRINTPTEWGVTQAKNDINIQTKNQDLASNLYPSWDNPGTSILMENIDVRNASGIGYASCNFVVENLGFEDLRIYGVLLNKNGNESQNIINLKLIKGNQTLNAEDMIAGGGIYDFILGKSELLAGNFLIQTSDDNDDNIPDNNYPTPTIEVYSNDLNPNKTQTVVDDFDIGSEDLQSRWNINVNWTVTPFVT